MCGRYDLSRNAQEILRFFGIEAEVDWPPRYNIAPSQNILTIHAGANGRPVAAWSHWGFKPSYAEEKQGAPAPINARAEKIADSAYFRSSFAKRRAIIPADGWYEWRAEAGRKQPYRFMRRDGGLLLLAGLWTPSAQEPGERVAIITEPARGLARQVHPRMPVVLNDPCWRAWLDPALTEGDAIREVTAALPIEQIRAYPVSPRVGNPRHDEATLIEASGEDLPRRRNNRTRPAPR
ncbi:MAG: SOS response-associated peptidase [Nitrococcus mobilis]|nr:SOS response-associated peptidase [Nitrococcus mobilis]